MNEEQRLLLIEMLLDLELQIDEEYYSFTRESFDEHVKNVERLFGVKYDSDEARRLFTV